MMHTPSIDTFHASIDKQIKLVHIRAELKHIDLIIRMCRLKPYELIKNPSKKLVRYRKWFDEFGCSLNLITRHHVKIIPNDLSIDRKRIICTDLYGGLSLNQTLKMSKLLHLYWGKEEDTGKRCGIITLLGLDNYLRSFMYSNDEWSRVSPLLLGRKNLEQLSNHVEMLSFKRLKKFDGIYLPCKKPEVWISGSMPFPKLFLRAMKKRHEELYAILTNGGAH